MKRIFFAVDISDEARRVAGDRISKIKDQFPDVRASWVRPENLHITLKFVGNATDEQIEALQCLSAAFEKAPPFPIQLTSPSAFGRRVISVSVADRCGSLRAINEILECACERVGFQRDQREFKPHLTLARIRDGRGADALIRRHAVTPTETIEWKVAEVVLYESKLGSAGSVYSKLKSFPLAGG